jgi:thiol-disulfide isomerase/thioredoxin
MIKVLLTILPLLSLVTPVGAQQSLTLAGQVVCCEDCWAEADRRTTPYGTAEDLAKAVGCVAEGDPTLLAVTDGAGRTTFYELTPGKFKLPGSDWLEYVGRRVEIVGAVKPAKPHARLRVDALKVTAPSPAELTASRAVGTQAELTLKDLFGVEQRLSALAGRVVILNFWATWCGPCREEMRDLAAIQNEYAAFGVQVVGAAADTHETINEVRQFIKTAKVNFPVWLGATTGDMARFGVGPALPATVIIGRDGKIIAAIQGAVKRDDLKRRLEKLVAEATRQAERDQVASARTGAKSRGAAAEVSSVPS